VNPFAEELQQFASRFPHEDLRLSIDPLIAPSALLGSDVDYNNFLNSLSNRRFAYRPFCVLSFKSKKLETNIKVIREFLAFVQAHAPKSQTEYQIKVHSGGHQHEGECSGDRAIVFDLSHMDSIVYDPKKKTVALGPGTQFAKIHNDEILRQHWVGIPSGACDTVAVAGFTLGGGWGPFTRMHGMGCDSVLGATIILHDGRTLECSAEKEPDLFWALKGGGLGFGIVVEFVYQTFDLPDTYVEFSVKWDESATLGILDTWREIILNPDTVNLLGTNFLITPMAEIDLGQSPIEEAIFKGSCFNGNYAGNEKDFRAFLESSGFPAPSPPNFYITTWNRHQACLLLGHSSFVLIV
jgi:hypothetical protein